MNLKIYLYAFCLIFVVPQIAGVDTGWYYKLADFKFPVPESKSVFTYIFLKLNSSRNSLNNIQNSSYFVNLKRAISDVGNLLSKVRSNINILFRNSDDFYFDFKLKNTVWNWTTWFPESPSPEFNASAFDFQINSELYGQPIIGRSLPKLLDDHLNSAKPKKHLVMSFHGPAGCGKSFVSKMIVNSLLNDGFESKCIHTYYGSLDFPREENKEKYSDRLLYDASYIMRSCDKSLFIFEELDKMAPDVIDIIIPFINPVTDSSRINSTRSIFIFLSNSGYEKIDEIVYEAWLEGIPRDDLTLADFSYFLKEAAYHQPGGLQHSKIVNQNLIDVYLPFLPLEKEHVRQCIIKEMRIRELKLKEDVIKNIADQLEYYPPEFELYSVCGCKRISHKIDLYSEDDL